ncbi:MAG TPA: hypothetical protein VNF00_01760, partial [Candidatus Acidoferrales bacterium]|nr:hypothetical protein [Candidatus Acidoferrales bacterium]
DLWNKHRDPKTKSNPNTMRLPITLGEDHGSGHFYLAENRTFLLCVDSESIGNMPVTSFAPEEVEMFKESGIGIRVGVRGPRESSLIGFLTLTLAAAFVLLYTC